MIKLGYVYLNIGYFSPHLHIYHLYLVDINQVSHIYLNTDYFSRDLSKYRQLLSIEFHYVVFDLERVVLYALLHFLVWAYLLLVKYYIYMYLYLCLNATMIQLPQVTNYQK